MLFCSRPPEGTRVGIKLKATSAAVPQEVQGFLRRLAGAGGPSGHQGTVKNEQMYVGRCFHTNHAGSRPASFTIGWTQMRVFLIGNEL